MPRHHAGKHAQKHRKYPLRIVLLFIAVLSAIGITVAQANHTDTPVCESVTGAAPAVQGGASGKDSGAFDFDSYEAEASGSHDYRACIRQDSSQKIEGFGWNTNLGDVSFACTGGTNLGASCGSMDYGARAYVMASGAFAGKTVLAGYAWGDNMGWISLACQNFDGDPALENFLDGDPANTAPGNEISCGTIPYGTLLNDEGIAVDDVAFGSSYGWTNSVGWVRFTGVKFPASQVVIGTDPPGGLGDPDNDGVYLISVDPAFFLDEAATRIIPFADGKDGYSVVIRVKKGGVTLKPGTDVGDISSTPVFVADTENNIVYDQLGDTRNKGAGHMADFAWDDTLEGYVAYITSVAPTSPGDTFILRSVNVSEVLINGDPNKYSKPINFDATLEFNPAVEITELNSKDPNTNSFQTNCPGGTCRLHGSRNSPNDLKVTVKRYTSGGGETHPKVRPPAPGLPGFPSNSQISVNGEFLNEDGTGPYSDPALPETQRAYSLYYFPDTNLHTREIRVLDDAGLEIGTTLDIDGTVNEVLPMTLAGNFGFVDSSAGITPDSLLHSFYAYLPSSVEEVPEFSSSGARLKMTVSYTLSDNTKVSYAGKELTAGDIFNQFARFFGTTNIEEGAFQEVTKIRISDTEEESVGTPTLQRGEGEDFVLKIRKILSQKLRGKRSTNVSAPSGTVTLTETELRTLRNTALPGIIYITKQTTGYTSTAEPFKVVITDSVDNEVSGITDPVTVIVEGGNVFIDSNLLSTIGIVLLEDPSIRKPHANINVCANVTEVRASIRAEGSILSYGQDTDTSTPELDDPCGDKSVDSKGFPSAPYASQSAFEKQILRNQLTFIGPIQACFTSGGSTLLPPVKCDGTRALSADQIQAADQIQEAKRQDVNYLRYAGVVPQNPDAIDICVNDRNFSNPPSFQWLRDETGDEIVKRSPALGSDDCVNGPPNFGIVNFMGGERTNLPLID